MKDKNKICEEKLGEWLNARKNGDRKKLGKLLDSICDITGLHRKSVSRAFRRLQFKKSSLRRNENRGRKKYYGHEVDMALKMIWEASGCICGELLYGVIGEYVQVFKKSGDWHFESKSTDKLLQMSVISVRRRIEDWCGKISKGKGLVTTRSSPLKQIIPIFEGNWKDLPPGNGQIDTVAHCGDSIAGSFIYTLNYTDFATYWVELAAQWNKGQEATVKSFDAIRERLPFSLEMVHPDTGSEFINYHLKAYCESHLINLTRSRPYHKNDNMAVEERNGHLVREALGYLRLDNPLILPLINYYLNLFCLHRNHFVPSKRTISKTKTGSKYIYKREKVALTPYQRVMKNPDIPCVDKKQLQVIHQSLNPLKLRLQCEQLCVKIFSEQHRKNY
jgi:hypothetical protein